MCCASLLCDVFQIDAKKTAVFFKNKFSFPLTKSTVYINHRRFGENEVRTTRMASFKNAVVRSSTLMHFSAFLKSFYMVHDKLYYFVFKLIAKKWTREIGSSVWFLCF